MGSFTAALERFEDLVGERLDKAVRYFVLEARTRIIIRTPVDTGRARNNWQYGVEAAPGGVLPAGDRSGQGAMGRIEASIPIKAAGQVHYIVNNLSYIQSLEDGGSDQAPSGMVRLTMKEAPEILRRAVAAAKL